MIKSLGEAVKTRQGGENVLKTVLRESLKEKHWKVTIIAKISVILLPIFIGIVLVGRRDISIQALISRNIGPPSTNPNCTTPPMNDCGFYANCLESRYRCGYNGYPIGYGQTFCKKFVENRTLLDARGQRWMVNTMHCLQSSLVPDAIDSNATTCSALETKAFGTHAGCYVSNGLCSLGILNWEAIIEIVDIKTLFASWDALKATVEAARDCAEFIALMVAKELF